MTFRPEAGFVAGYALVLLGAAWALWRLGHVNTDPWSSRLFAAYRREREVPQVAVQDWPHSEAPRLYTGLAMVAAVAATLLCAAEAIRHHAPLELGALVGVAIVGLLAITRLSRHLRVMAPSQG